MNSSYRGWIRLVAAIPGLLLACATGGQVLFNHLGTDPNSWNSTDKLILKGNAIRTDQFVRLTSAQHIQAGSLWLTRKQNIKNGFGTVFQFQITEPRTVYDKSLIQDLGGDGFAFLIQNASVEALGRPGGCLGYAGITNSLAIEFDTWDNHVSGQPWIGDPNDNHISVHSFLGEANSELEGNTLGLTANIPNLSDRNPHTVRIEYVPGNLSIYMDDLALPVLSVKVDLDQELSLDDGRAWVGFTSATWDAFENHDILNWAFTGAEL
jgi:hypothetical protein